MARGVSPCQPRWNGEVHLSLEKGSIMLARLITCAAAALVCAAAPLAAQCPAQVDQVALPVGGATNIGSDFGFELGQSFVPANATISAVEIFFAENTSVDQTTPVRLTIWKSSSYDFTTGTLVGSVMEMVPEGPSVDTDPSPAHQSSYVFAFDPPLVVEVGATYVIQVAEDQTPSNTDLSWRGGDTYASGEAIKDGSAAVFPDWAFKTFGLSCTVPVETTSWGRVKALYE